MKIKNLFICAGLATITALPAVAQKGELSTAKSSFDNYDALRATNNTALLNQALTKAKTAIDKASVHEKTSALPETYALKAVIYAYSAMQDSVETTSAPLFTAAEEALAKGKELDVKKENEKYLTSAEAALAQGKLNSGVSFYKAQKFEDAYKAFNDAQKYAKGDTTAMYYAGISAGSAKNYAGAIDQYKKLIATNFSERNKIYLDLSSLYLAAKDTVNAINIATEAVQKFPNDAELRKREIEVSLQAGKVEQVLSKITSAIEKDPKNKNLYYYAGITYSQVAEALKPKITKTKDPVALANLQKEKEANFTKAADMLKKALEIDPDYYDAILNLGYVTLNPAIDTYNAAQQLPNNKQKEYDAAIAKSKAQFEAARPFLEKATQVQPNNVDGWSNLKTYYIGTQNTAKANETQKKIDELNAKK